MILEDVGYYANCEPPAIIYSAWELQKYKIYGHRHFYVVFTIENFLLTDEYLYIVKPGYDAIFFTPMTTNVSVNGWDIVLYDSESHEALAKIEWRQPE